MIANFKPALWSALLNKALEKILVYGSATNSNYQGEITGKGCEVKILEIGDISIVDYVPDVTELAYEKLKDASQSLKITESKAFAFKCDDVDKIQSHVDLLKPATAKATYAVRNVIDQFIASKYTEAGITDGIGDNTTPIEINSANAAEYIIHMARLLDDEDVPDEGRYIILPPWYVEKLIIAKIWSATDNTEVMNNGFIFRYAGFDVKKSTNVPTVDTTKYKVIAGYNGAITYAGQASEIEALRLEKSFSDAVRGLYLYGSKVIKPDGLACGTFTEAAEV